MKRLAALLLLVGPATAHADKTFNMGNGATWDCAKDADVTINASGGTYTLKGACSDLNVNGSDVKVTADSVKDLTVNGSTNTLTIGAVDDINVNGDNNTVTWGSALKAGKKPSVSSLGTGNSIKAGAAGTTAAPSTGTSAPPAQSDASKIDCAKRKAVSITTGGGSYAISGTCDKISIAGGNNKLVIEAAKNLAITGSNNDVAIAKADKIAAMGANNTVAYGGGLSVAKPKVAVMGKNNKVSAGAAAAAAGTGPATAGGSAAGGNSIDCGKTATHAITGNEGNFVFTGTCTLITVDGNDNNLKVEAAKKIVVNGNHNNVDVMAVDLLSTTGNENGARYKKGMSRAKPKISNLGTHNKIAKVK